MPTLWLEFAGELTHTPGHRHLTAMKTPLSLRMALSLVSTSMLASAAPARAVLLDWTGTVTVVEADTGAGRFAGAGLGAEFNGLFSYGDVCGAGCTPFFEPDEADYEFEGPGFGALLTQGGNAETGSFVFVNVQDDRPLSADEAALVSALIGMPVAAGTLVDVWNAGSETDDAVFDEDADILLNGGFVEIVFLSLDTSLFDDTSYRPLPPAIGDVDLAGFFVEQAISGTQVYSVFGLLDSTAVPEPGPTLLLASAIAAGLVRARAPGRARGRQRRRSSCCA